MVQVFSVLLECGLYILKWYKSLQFNLKVVIYFEMVQVFSVLLECGLFILKWYKSFQFYLNVVYLFGNGTRLFSVTLMWFIYFERYRPAITLLHSEWPKLNRILAVLSAIVFRDQKQFKIKHI